MIKFQTEFNLKQENKQLVIGVFTDVKHALISQVDRALNKQVSVLLDDCFISTDFGKVTPIHSQKQLKAKQLHFIGLGESKDFTLEKAKKIFGKIAKNVTEDALILLDSFETSACTLNALANVAGEALTLARYKVVTYKTNQKQDATNELSIYSSTHVELPLTHGIVYGEATNEARTLVNEPASSLTASMLADRILTFAQTNNLEARCVEKEEMKELGMGGLLGVNQGSIEDPKMIIVKYQGTSRFENITALVGKGLTFDTGGYSLKPGASMYGMHTDMGGAASAFGAFMIAVRLKLAVNLLLVIPATDNMVSATAIKPGDVLKTMSTKTVEVSNTDAEGRLILADGLTFAKHLGASKIINLATLTGAIVAALGDITGAFTNNQAFFDEFLSASQTVNEDVWQMPIHERHHEAIRSSSVADLINSPVGKPGAIMAATFLKEFVEETPWIHLDIAGTTMTRVATDLNPKGATGTMVRSIAKYLELSAKKA